MPRTRNINLAAFNIVTHPHSPEEYGRLFETATKRADRSIKIWGDTVGRMSRIAKLDFDGETLYTGEVYTYVDVNNQLKWFNEATGEEATEEEIGEVIIPSGIKFNLRRFRFAFYPHSHLFTYVQSYTETGTIGPLRMQVFLERVLNESDLLQSFRFNQVDIRLVQDSQSIERLEKMHLEKIGIILRKRNPDGTGDIDREIEDELNQQNIEEFKLTLKSPRGGFITPNEHTVGYMHKAVANGRVEATVITDDGNRERLNTASHPIIMRFDIAPADQILEGILGLMTEMKNKIKDLL